MGRAEWQWRSDGWFFEGSAQIGEAFDDAGGVGPKVRVDRSGRLILTGTESQFGVQQDNLITAAAEHEIGGGNLRLSASFTDLPYGAISVDTLVQPPGGDLDNYHQSQKTAETSARYDRDFGERLGLEVVPLSRNSAGTVCDDHFSEAPQVAAVTGDDTSDIFDLNDRRGASILSGRVLRFTFSKTLCARTQERRATITGSPPTRRSSKTGRPSCLPAADEYVAVWRSEAFALLNWRPSQLVNLDAGLRLEASRLTSSGDSSSDQSFVYPKPRALLTLSPHAGRSDPGCEWSARSGQLDFNNFIASPLQHRDGSGAGRQSSTRPPVRLGLRRRGGAALLGFRRPDRDPSPLRALRRHRSGAGIRPRGRLRRYGQYRRWPQGRGFARPRSFPLDRAGLTGARISGQSTWRWSRVIDPTTGVPRSISALPPNTWELQFSESLPRRLVHDLGIDAVGEYSLRIIASTKSISIN